ncbi:hypothetical protein SAMN04489723_1285 [Algoriphagus aquimarinus]|uniref:Uncharacterized protein n=1 Tax=Algoriphagus aquimarinus TaxID=237018 RepID=A0A1I1CCS6_9BACT|nr:hypothetical protein SAMN04489723_1285 [Algoriphagus aquimarinus]
MRHTETITAFFHSSSLYSMKGVFLCVHFEELILAVQFGGMQSIDDRLYPLKPKNPI